MVEKSANANKSHLKGPEDFQEELEALKDAVASVTDKVKKKSCEHGQEVLDKAKEHPAATLGIAVGVGLLLGMLIKK